ncbi:hypothetical protein MTY66_63850 (plasmid) [Mycolicibacterium sp. TY66]|nr:hypothetical protein MTY66_63850 [Mycolicibacterium sp. TY66]BCJ84974.1 hypothetical protein MTY81_63470 [Mycolicibacterium sp. TY81]
MCPDFTHVVVKRSFSVISGAIAKHKSRFAAVVSEEAAVCDGVVEAATDAGGALGVRVTPTIATTKATVPMATPSKPVHDHFGRGGCPGDGGQAGGTPVLPCGYIIPA